MNEYAKTVVCLVFIRATVVRYCCWVPRFPCVFPPAVGAHSISSNFNLQSYS